MVSTRGKRVPSAAARDAAASARYERELELDEQQPASTPEPNDTSNGDETIGSRLRRKRRRDTDSPAVSRSAEQRKRRSTQPYDASPTVRSPNTPSASAPPKRRGRPPKNRAKEEDSPAPAVVKRGPGRPRKNKLEVLDNESNGARKRRKPGMPTGLSRRRASSLSRSSEIGDEIIVQTPTSPGPGRRRWAAAIASPHRPPPAALEQHSRAVTDTESPEAHQEQTDEKEQKQEPEPMPEPEPEHAQEQDREQKPEERPMNGVSTEPETEENPEVSDQPAEPVTEAPATPDVEPVSTKVPGPEAAPSAKAKPEPMSEDVTALEPPKERLTEPEPTANASQDSLRPGPAVTILKIIDYCAEVNGLKKLGREYGRGLDTEGLPTEGAPRALKIEALAILQELAEQLLHAFATIGFAELASYVVERDSVGGKAYARLKQLFDDTKKVYATKDHFLILEEIGDLRQGAISIARKANLATFATSCFGSGDVGFFHLDQYFLDVVALEASRLLKQQATLFLELKTQAFVSAMHADGRPAYQLIQEIFPTDLEQKLLQRRPGAKALAQSELEFIRQLRLRKEELKQIHMGTSPLDEKRRKLREQFPWDKFLIELCSYVTKNFDSIVGKQPADLKPLHESGLSLSPKASNAGLIPNDTAANGPTTASASEGSQPHPPPPPYMTPGFQPPQGAMPASNKGRQRPTPHLIDTNSKGPEAPEQSPNAQPNGAQDSISERIIQSSAAPSGFAPSTELRSPRYQSYTDRSMKSPYDQPVSPRNFPPMASNISDSQPAAPHPTSRSTTSGPASRTSGGAHASYTYPSAGPHGASYGSGGQSSYVSPFAPQESNPSAPPSTMAGAPQPPSSLPVTSQGLEPYYAAFQRPHSQQSKPTHELYEEARRIAHQKNPLGTRTRPSTLSQRRPWTTEEETALMAGLDTVKGPHWSSILAIFGKDGSINEALKGRNQVQLKDKARNLKLFFLKSGIEVPYYLQFVTGDLKRASLPGQSTPPPEDQTVNAVAYGDSEAARRVSMPARVLGPGPESKLPGASAPYGYAGPTSQPTSTSHPSDPAIQAAMKAARAYENLPRRESEPVHRSTHAEWASYYQQEPPHPPSSISHGYPPSSHPAPPSQPHPYSYGPPPPSRTSSYGGEPPPPARSGSYGGYPGPASRNSSYGGHPASRTSSYSGPQPMPPMNGPSPPPYQPPPHHYPDHRSADRGPPHAYPHGPPPPQHAYGSYPQHSHYPPPPYGPPPPSSPVSRNAPQLPPPHSPRQYGAPSPHAMRNPHQQPGQPQYQGPQSPRMMSGPPPPPNYHSPQRPGSSHQYGPLPPLRPPPQGSPRVNSQTLLSPHSGSQTHPSPRLSQSHHSPQSVSQALPSPHPGSQHTSPHPAHPSPRPSLSLPPPYAHPYHHGPPSGGAPPGYSPHHPPSPRNHPLPPPPPPPSGNNQLPPIQNAEGHGYGPPRQQSVADPSPSHAPSAHATNNSGALSSSQASLDGSRQQEFKFRHWGEQATGRKRSSVAGGGEANIPPGDITPQSSNTGQPLPPQALPSSMPGSTRPMVSIAPQETKSAKESRSASRALAREERDRQKALEREQLRWNVRGVDGRGGMVKVEESAKRGPWSQWSRSEKGRERERAAAEKNWKGAAAIALAREKEQEAADAERVERAAAPNDEQGDDAPTTNGAATDSTPGEQLMGLDGAEDANAGAAASTQTTDEQPTNAAKTIEMAEKLNETKPRDDEAAATTAKDAGAKTAEAPKDDATESDAVTTKAEVATDATEPKSSAVKQDAEPIETATAAAAAATAAAEAPASSGWTAVNR